MKEKPGPLGCSSTINLIFGPVTPERITPLIVIWCWSIKNGLVSYMKEIVIAK
jgi:hypothetical protein